MPIPLTEQEVLGRRRGQKADIYFRECFLQAGPNSTGNNSFARKDDRVDGTRQ